VEICGWRREFFWGISSFLGRIRGAVGAYIFVFFSLNTVLGGNKGELLSLLLAFYSQLRALTISLALMDGEGTTHLTAATV
jgi:hypothetical protein